MVDCFGLYDMDKIKKRILNHVCLPMEIYAVSDLVKGNGLRIRQDMVGAYTPGAEEQIQYEWPQK